MDTTSILENKETTKEYWEKRMMAEQGLIDAAILKESSVKSASDSHQLNEGKLSSKASATISGKYNKL